MKTKTIFTILVLFFASNIHAKKAVYNAENYKICVNYNDTAAPGDAIFARLMIEKSKTSKANFTAAKLELYMNEKIVRSSDFYFLGKPSKTNKTMLTGIPLSSWWTKDEKYSLKVIYKISNKEKEFTLPFVLKDKTFNSETLELNESNTAIKTDTSTKRMDQIQKLNSIFETINPNNVYSTKPFVLPVDSTRITSFFADRRIYKYTTGKTSTNLHFGIDYGIPTGTTVHSVSGGKVVLAENRISTGWSVVIEHLPGLYSIYYHLNELKVKEGDNVKAGTIIGFSGATGLATGPHLHWEIRLNREAVNPDFFLQNYTFESIGN